MKKWYIMKGVKIAFFVLIGIFLMGYIVMSLWNWLVPDLFHGPVISYCQAFGLLILSKILFGGFKGRHCGPGGHWRHKRHEWKRRWEEKMANMTPEEREKFRRQLKDRCRNWDWDKTESEKKD